MTHTQLETLTGDYAVDLTRTRLGFAVRHAMVTTVHGHFIEFEGRAHLDLVEPSRSWASVAIEAASIETGLGARDAHLRSSDFLDASRHPYITFRSADVVRSNANTLRVTGDLTMRGVSRSLSLDFTHSEPDRDPQGHDIMTFLGSTAINRHDWGMTWNAAIEAGGVLVSERVVLELQVGVVRTD